MHRRSFVAGATTAAILMGINRFDIARAAGSGAREDIETFSKDPQKVASLRLAFQKLYDRPKDQKVGWFNYAAIHGIPSNDPDAGKLPATIKAYWSQCHNDESLFFIWHRAYLAAIERNLQKLSGVPTLRLPYWDWYKNPSLPAIFREEFLDAGKKEKNSLYNRNRDPAVQAGDDVWFSSSSGALDDTSFFGFQTGLDGSEHGDIHIGVAGGAISDMGRVPTAARDPIFWLHHCNIDRLFTAWISLKRKAPDQAASFAAGKFAFPIDQDADYKPVASTLDMNSTSPLGQVYESLEAPFSQKVAQVTKRPPVSRTISANARPFGRSILALNAATSVTVPTSGVSLAFALPSDSDPRLNSVFNSVPLREATSVIIVLEGVRLDSPANGLTGFDVFVNLPEGQQAGAGDYKVGSIALFNLTVDHGDHHGGAGSTFRFAATNQARLRGELTSNVVVSLVPRFTPRADQTSVDPSLQIKDFRVEVSSAPLQ